MGLQTSDTIPLYFPLCLILLNTICSTIFAFTNETDRMALLEFKSHIAYDPSLALESWNNSVHFCSWHGVTCSRQHQRVTMLNLSSLGLAGSFTPSLSNLTFLKEIIMNQNSFRGRIPREISQLFRLERLVLSSNFLQGDLPTDITNCSSLKELVVDRNSLDGSIPTQLSSMSHLQVLDMSENLFTGWIPTCLRNLSALRVLTLSGNRFSGIIPSEIGWLSNLEILELSSNNFSGEVPPLLYNISSIQYFSLSFNSFRGIVFPLFDFRLPKLRVFRVQANLFSGVIPASITNSSQLEELDMSLNAIAGPLPSDFVRLQRMRVLQLNGNKLTGDLRNFILNLSTELTSLRLDHNYISGGIPEGIQNLANLQNLLLSENILTGRIPDSIGKLSRLQGIDLSNNEFYGNIPSSIGNITLLSILRLRGNRLEGEIPISLGNCKKLQSLDLSDNRLTGNIPVELYRLSSLSLDLNLSWNQLSGHLPRGLSNLVNLGSLDLSNNNLSGEIFTLASLDVLEFLYLQGNHFRGTIPRIFTLLRGIQIMDLSRNSLYGKIPRDLSDLPFIRYLNLSFNKLEGEVPSGGVFSNSSAFSILENKALCGSLKSVNLPPCRNKGFANQRKLSTDDLLIILVGVGGGVFLLTVFVFLLAVYFRQGIPLASSVFEISKSFVLNMSKSSESPLGKQYPKVSYAGLRKATAGFSPTNVIGRGRYGCVYVGTLSISEEPVAVKVVDLQQRGANRSFIAECEALRNIRHRNIIKTITACSGIDFQGRDFKALVYELMPNGSLDSWLHPDPTKITDSSKCLSLVQRLDIAIDVASALHYLHNSCEMPIIHRDLKPSNILLDRELCAHLSDFGLARFLMASTERAKRVRSTGIAGTVGYIALEYGVGGSTTTLVDVYSYGILLLEMFTGKRPTEEMFKDEFSLRNYVRVSLPGRVMTVVDPLLISERHDESSRSNQTRGGVEECLASIFRVGVICSSQSPKERMDAADVLMQLTAIKQQYLKHIIR